MKTFSSIFDDIYEKDMKNGSNNGQRINILTYIAVDGIPMFALGRRPIGLQPGPGIPGGRVDEAPPQSGVVAAA